MYYPEEIIDSENWIKENFFSGKEPFEPPVYVTYERILRFIEETSDVILQRVKEYFD